MLVAAIAFTIFGFVIVQWRVSGPIQRMTGAMKRLADRDLDVIIPYVDRGAEIGEMAGAVQVFKDSMIARERAEAEIAQQRADSEHRRQEREARETAAGEEIAALVNRVAEGDLSGRVGESGKEGFFLSASQQLNLFPGANYDGVYSIWYGKGPGATAIPGIAGTSASTGTVQVPRIGPDGQPVKDASGNFVFDT
ncbi:HAMP domain-containing protein, partial [Vreelandella neptunia]|uniref:HAMP domain-containing protein n=1 Tax=Vreelandella neptunia TaxID=115551 RepID=UPI0025B40868